jgi:hypothetical protein
MNAEKNASVPYPPEELKSGKQVNEPLTSRRLLDPIERISEILFGLIMALSFTCAVSVAEASRFDVRQMLVGAIGCNIAWGIIDAIMFLINRLAQRGRDLTVFNFVRDSNQPEKSLDHIADALSPELAEIIKRENLELIRKDIVNAPAHTFKKRLYLLDFKMALGVFLLVFISTFPVAIPFAIAPQVHLALRISNGIAIVLLFLGGWYLARYGGYRKLRTGLLMALIGVLLVFLTISLGG